MRLFLRPLTDRHPPKCPLFQAVGSPVIPLCVSCLFVRLDETVLTIEPTRSVGDFFLLGCFYKGAKYADALITPEHLALPHPSLYTATSIALWAAYSFAAGLVATGLWVVAHECGHQAFSESKAINHTVGWVLHSA